MSLTLKQKLAVIVSTNICKDMKTTSARNDVVDIQETLFEALESTGGTIHDAPTVDDTDPPVNTEDPSTENPDENQDDSNGESDSNGENQDEDGSNGNENDHLNF